MVYWGQYNLANRYYDGNGIEQDYSKAVEWYRKSAEQGNADAQRKLGDCYYNGDIVEKDIDEAEKWYTKAAEQQNIYSMRQVGIIELGKNNYEEAFKYFIKAAENGDAEAQNRAAVRYSNGQGVNKNMEKARYWWEKSANQGYEKAQCNLANYYYNGVDTGIDYDKAVFWHKKLADKGYAWNKYVLGNCYYYGYGVAQNYDLAINLYEEAAGQCAEAQGKVGDYYLNGIGRYDVNYHLALYYYNRASKKNKTQIGKKLVKIGDEFNYGIFREQDNDMALLCYKIASNAGNQKARTILEVMWAPYIIVTWKSWDGNDFLGTGNISTADILKSGEEFIFKIELCNINIKNYHVFYSIEENHAFSLSSLLGDSGDDPFSVKWGEWTDTNTIELILKKNNDSLACEIEIKVYCKEIPECSVNISFSC